MHLSFRNRLTFFFILLVILPVLAVASVGILIVRNSEEGKNNDALEQAKRAAASLYSDAEDRARAVAQTSRPTTPSRSRCATATARPCAPGSRRWRSGAAPSSSA